MGRIEKAVLLGVWHLFLAALGGLFVYWLMGG